MNEEFKQNRDPDMLEEYDFSQGVRGKYYERHQGPEIIEQSQVAGELAIGAITTAVAGILSLVTGSNVGHVAVGIGTGFVAWQNLQLNKFQERVRRRLIALDRHKLDQEVLRSDEFKSLVIQTVEAASKTASESKQKALASALVNSLVPPTSKFRHKEALLRILSQLSPEETQVLKVIYQEEPRLLDAELKQRDERYKKVFFASDQEVVEQLGWAEEDVRIACEGLSQLGVVYNPIIGAAFVPENPHGCWRITSLGQKLMRWSQKKY